MPRAPAVTTIGRADLPSINQTIRKISQRLDYLDDNPAVSAAEVAVLRRQLGALQIQVQSLVSTTASDLSRVRFESDRRISRDQLRLPALNIADGLLFADGTWDARGTRWTDEPI